MCYILRSPVGGEHKYNIIIIIIMKEVFVNDDDRRRGAAVFEFVLDMTSNGS